jgi:ribonuclease HII
MTFGRVITRPFFFLYMDYSIEKALQDRGYENIVGVDEAGRGPLAGPIVAGAVIFGPEIMLQTEFCELLNDSKKLSEKKRLKLYPLVKEYARAWSVFMVHNNEIDEKGIQHANIHAMASAISGLDIAPDYILTDYVAGFTDPLRPFETVKKGDSTVLSIAAASILAKVDRDALMLEYAKVYPEYAFEKHKGYGTKAHSEAIIENGLSPIHRRSFCRKFL